jgi:predicted amino acid dehydrogenase
MYQKKLSINDENVELNIICLPYLPKYMIRIFADAQVKIKGNRESEIRLLEMQDKIQDAAKYAKYVGDRSLPVDIIGLGAYNSIITENALQFNDLELPVTSGNAYTTALMYQGILKAIRDKNMDIYNCKVAIVGAGGNIGRAIAELFSPLAKKLILVGRDTEEGQKKVESVKNLCYKFIEPHMNRFYEKPEDEPIIVGTLNDVSNADIVVVTTNSSDANLITPDKVKPGSIICCASVPSNLSEQFKNCTDKYFVFDSGYAKLPGNKFTVALEKPYCWH